MYVSEDDIKLSICKIFLPDGTTTSGFFFALPKGGKSIYCLTSVEHKITTQMIQAGQTIKLDYPLKEKVNGEFKRATYDLCLGNRTTYPFHVEDIVFISLTSEEQSKFGYFLNADPQYHIGGGLGYYNNKDLLFYHHPNGGNLRKSEGTMVAIDEDLYHFGHNCESDRGSAGGPILLKLSGCVMGVHYAKNKTKGYNLGVAIGKVIDLLKNMP